MDRLRDLLAWLRDQGEEEVALSAGELVAHERGRDPGRARDLAGRTSLAGQIPSLPTKGTGLGANPADNYVTAWLDRTFGPNHNGHNIAVLHGKLPSTPATYAGEPRMQGGTQLRYWSVCNSEGLPSGKTTGPCLADEEVPINAQRDYTIIADPTEIDPASATSADPPT